MVLPIGRAGLTQAVLGVWALAIVLVAAARPAWLLAAAVVLSVFEGAAVVDAGGMAVSPYYLLLALVAARCVTLKTCRGRVLGHTPGVRRIMGWTALLAVLCVGSAVVLPRVFAGTAVHSPRLAAEGTAPLEPSGSNTGQAMYLVLNVMLMWYAAQQPNPAAAARSAVRGVMIAGVVVVVVAFWELASVKAGVPFPEDVVRSNRAFVMQSNSFAGEWARISSTFTEPAGMAVFLVGLVALLTGDVGRVAGVAWRVPLLAGAVAVLVISTSSTGLVGLAVVGAWRASANLLLPMLRGRLSAKQVLLTVGGLAVIAGVFASSADLRDLVRQIVLEKDQTASYEERTAANADGMKLGLTTLGLGTGLGSNRASGFLPSMVSSIGVWGVVLLGIVVLLLVRSPRGAGANVRTWHRGLAAALLGTLLAKCMSSPDLSTASMWSLMAALVAVHAAADVVPADVVETAVTERVVPDWPPMGTVRGGVQA